MKKLFFTLALVLNGCLSSFSQATSLTVDCQNPGWLSSMINYGNQQTLESLKVIGYINGTDLQFIRRLNSELSLRGVIDLENANLVSGGEAYYKSYKITETDVLPIYAFAELKSIQKVILPKSIKRFEADGNSVYQFYNTIVDTLVINGQMTDVKICYGANMKYWLTRCIYFAEGIENIDFGLYLNPGSRINDQVIHLPSTLKSVKGSYRQPENNTIVLHSPIVEPESVIELSSGAHYFNSGTIYVPKGTTEKYKKSIFEKLTIIENIPVESVSLKGNDILYLGDETKFQAEVFPTDALNQTVKWESDNPDIVTVSDDGVLTAISFGTANITVTTIDGGFKATCKVYVYEHTTGIKMDDKITVPIGGTHLLNAQTFPLSTSDGRITYHSGNEDIATVNEVGLITAKAKGACKVTATSVDGGYTTECLITVTQPVDALSLEKHELNLKVSETDKLFAQIVPLSADNKKIDWSSSIEQIATVDASGNVTAVKAGEAWIRAVSQDNAEAKDSCKVIVIQPVSGITLSHSTYQLNGIGSSFNLEATISPEDASNRNVKWTSSNESVCVVSQGQVIAVGEGTCVIIAKAEDGGFLATCTVTVTTKTGLASIEGENGNLFQVFDANGTKRAYLQRGFNIIRFRDGTRKKVAVK